MDLQVLATQVRGFAIDSRKVEKGGLFFALSGAKVDGHAFLPEVASRGGVGAVVRADYRGPSYGLELIPVPDPLEALQGLARRHLAAKACKVVGITGSLGKTTTKEFVKTLLSPYLKVVASPGNANSQVSLPLNILHAEECEVLILEMGMTQEKEIAQLVSIAPPDIAVVTNIALSHAVNFQGQEGIAKAKSEIFTHPKTKWGIYNKDAPFAEMLASVGACEKLSFSMKDRKANYFLEAKEELFLYEREKLCLTTPWKLLGLHLLPNFLASYAVARTLNLSSEQILKAIPFLELPALRLQRMEKKGVVFINDGYNASSPEAVVGALSCLPKATRKVAVLGEMRELGSYTREAHKQVAQHALTTVDALFCLGEEWAATGETMNFFTERGALIEALRAFLQPGDVVLLKGSLSLEIYKIFDEF